MQDILAMTYLWLKAGHIIFVIFWMAGLFMLPRLFIYHQEAVAGSEEEARFIERYARMVPRQAPAGFCAFWISWLDGCLCEEVGGGRASP
jgi:putative membrane protein